VRSIITPPKLTHPPGSDTSQPGIFKHGSHIVKVLDLRQKFGVDAAEQNQPGNFIITIFEEESFAFWVDQILDVFDFPSEGWGNLPAAIPRGAFSRTLLLNKKIHLYSEFEKLATINDLGYLEHYIQQLKQQVTEKSTQPNTSQSTHQEHKKILSETSTSETINKPAADIKIDVKKENPISAIKNTPSNNTKPDTATTQSLPHTSIPKKVAKETNITTEVKTNHKPLIKKTANTQGKTQPVTVTTTPKVQKQVISKKEFKSHTHVENKTEEKSFPKQTTSLPVSHSDEETESYFPVIFFFIFILGCLGAGIYYLLLEDDSVKSYKYKKEQPVNSTTKLDYSITETYRSETFPVSEHITPIRGESDAVSEININNDKAESITDADSESITNTNYQADITQLDNEITITIHEPVFNSQSQQAEELITPLPVIEDDIKHEEVLETPLIKILKKDELSKIIAPEKFINEVIHTVVKGDTLWAIAKKYVNNPFLYPELARLSKIKNPHRIYPGNRVRIRFLKK
jgi:hypothetical protein